VVRVPVIGVGTGCGSSVSSVGIPISSTCPGNGTESGANLIHTAAALHFHVKHLLETGNTISGSLRLRTPHVIQCCRRVDANP
jgi:hypothetical protein